MVQTKVYRPIQVVVALIGNRRDKTKMGLTSDVSEVASIADLLLGKVSKG